MVNVKLITKLYTDGTFDSTTVSVPSIKSLFGFDTKLDRINAKWLGL